MAQITDSESSRLDLLSFKGVKQFIDSIPGIRDKLMIRLMYETGCSLKELVEIKAGDLQGSTIKFNDSGEVRFSKISGRLAKDLSNYILGNKLSKNSYVISTRQSSKMSEKRVRQLIQGYTEKFADEKINPLMFKYYHIAHAYQNGVFIEDISKQLGLSSLRIFQVLSEMDINPRNDLYYHFLNKI